MVIPIGAVVTAATGVKKRSRGQGLFLVSVKRSRTIFKLGNSGQDINVLHVRIAHSVVKCARSKNSQGPICGAVKQSSNKNGGQNFLTPVAAVTTTPIGVTNPCYTVVLQYIMPLFSVSHKLLNNLYCIDDEVRLLQPQISYCNHKTGPRAKKHLPL